MIGRTPILLSAWMASLLIGQSLASAQGWEPEAEITAQSRTDKNIFRGILPQYVDLSPNLPIPRSQGPTNTCTSWAATYVAASANQRYAQPASRKDLMLSPAFTYNLVSGEPHCMGLSSISKTLTLLRDVGALPFERFAFDPGWCGRQPTAAERAEAALYRIKGWATLDAGNLDAIKGRLASGTPLIFGMRVGPQFNRHRGPDVFDVKESGPDTEGHAMVAIGYDDARQALRVQNSAGLDWGDNGRFWMSYRLWRLQVSQAFYIE